MHFELYILKNIFQIYMCLIYVAASRILLQLFKAKIQKKLSREFKHHTLLSGFGYRH